MYKSYFGGLNENEEEIDAYKSEFSAVRHESPQNSVSFDGEPCSTFVDIAKDAFIKYYQGCYMELKNVDIFSPIKLDCDKSTEIRTVIKKEKNYLKFIISSKLCLNDGEKDGKWIRHAEGLMFEANKPGEICRIEEIKEKLGKAKIVRGMTVQVGMSKIEEKWNFQLCTYSGEEEALLEFYFPYEMIDYLKGYILSHGISDCVVDTAINSLVKSGWKQVSYDSLKLYGAIPNRFYAHIKRPGFQNKPDNLHSEYGFDIVLIDEDVNIFLEIQNYKIAYNDVYDNHNGKRNLPEVDAYPREKVYGYSTARHGRIVDDIRFHNDAAKFVSNLSWRQMDCRDRSVALLLGQYDCRLINYFKFFLGVKKGYHSGEKCFTDAGNWAEDVFHKNIMRKMGYALDIKEVDCSVDIHTYLSKVLDNGKAACTWFDEYYLFYTQFYLNSHTNHIAVVNGYNKEKKLYSIYDHNHLRVNNTSTIIDYGQFYCTDDTLGNIYSNLSKEQRLVITLDNSYKNFLLDIEKLGEEVLRILSSLIESQHPGRDIDTIYQSVGMGGGFEVGNIDKLYAQIGGKELLIDTIIKYFCDGYENKRDLNILANNIISDSNKLVNNYVISMYRGEALSSEEVSDSISIIRDYTTEFFKKVHSYLKIQNCNTGFIE
ncbi:MAG: BtrH N-terminal domain-containing protein [Bacillota bacterium]|nr:BtrH N-terminal domain-containing protein [Bacillota bacterium]